MGDFEGTAANSGFFIQDPAGDGDAATSDGIFVFTGSANTVDAGDYVRVTGFARERFNQTAFNGTNSNTTPVDRHPRVRHRQRRRDRRHDAVRERRHLPSATRGCSSASRSRS